MDANLKILSKRNAPISLNYLSQMTLGTKNLAKDYIDISSTKVATEVSSRLNKNKQSQQR